MFKKLFLFTVFMVLVVFSTAGCGNGSCTTGKSFGTRSLTKKDTAQTCFKELAEANFVECDWKRKDENETAKRIAYWQTLKITFGKECKEKDQSVECPDFIPESMTLTKLSGCEVYTVDPQTDCMAPCADFYFSTGDDTFHTVYIGGFAEAIFIKSSDKIKKASFSSSMHTGSNNAVFTWSEKDADGNKIEKEVSVTMEVTDPNAVEEEPFVDEDSLPDEP